MKNLYTLPEFLERNRLTRQHFAWLDERGRAPQTIHVDSTVLVSKAAERRWIKSMENTSPQAPPARRRLKRRGAAEG